jgi:hypothetical protein
MSFLTKLGFGHELAIRRWNWREGKGVSIASIIGKRGKLYDRQGRHWPVSFPNRLGCCPQSGPKTDYRKIGMLGTMR